MEEVSETDNSSVFHTCTTTPVKGEESSSSRGFSVDAAVVMEMQQQIAALNRDNAALKDIVTTELVIIGETFISFILRYPSV